MRLGIQSKINLALLTIIVAGVMGTGYYEFTAEKNAIETDLQQHAKQALQEIEFACKNSNGLIDPAFKKYLKMAMLDPFLTEVSIWKSPEKKQLLAQFHNEKPVASQPESVKKSSTDNSADPQTFAKKIDETELDGAPSILVLGATIAKDQNSPEDIYIEVAYDNSESTEMVTELQQSLLIRMGILIGGVVLVLPFILHKYVRTPLRDIATAMRQVGEGNNHARLSINTPDDLGKISTEFNVMAEKIQKAAQSDAKQRERDRKISQYTHQQAQKLQQALDKVAQGDFRYEFKVDQADTDTTEVKEIFNGIAKSLKNARLQQSQLLRQMRESFMQVDNSARDFTTTSEDLLGDSQNLDSRSAELKESMQVVSSHIENMASATEEMSVNSQTVSSGAEEMSMNMNAVASAIEEMSMSIREIASRTRDSMDVTKDALERTNQAAQTMNNLDESAEAIGKVTEVIKRIADQTNLLALNATIEAASAGEAGKGFAVVASEIKDLANQSAQAAEDIALKINGVQEGASGAVLSMKNIEEIIQKMASLSQVIGNSVEQQSLASNEISENVAEARKGIGAIASSISEISRGANDIAASASEISSSAEKVSKSSGDLHHSSRSGNERALKLKQASTELTELSSRLLEQIDYFKTLSDNTAIKPLQAQKHTNCKKQPAKAITEELVEVSV